MNAEEIKQTVRRSRDLQHEARSYPQDLADIDRGNYCVICRQCKQPFQGFKRRATCRLCVEAYYKKTIEAQAEEIKVLQTENNGRALAMGVLKSEYDKQVEETRLWKELNKAQSAYMDSQYVEPPDGIGGSDEDFEAWKKARAALSAFDSTRDKVET